MSNKPTAQGNLQKTPFAHLVLYMHARKLSGTLAIWPSASEPDERAQDRVLFRDGGVIGIRPRARVADAYEALVALFARGDGPYGFYADQNLLGTGDTTRSVRVESYTLLSAGLRAHPRPEVIDPVIARIGSRTIRMRPGVPLERLELNPKELALVDVLRAAPTTLDELLRSTDLGPRDVRRLFCLFALIRGVEATDGHAGLSPVSIDSLPPGASPSEPAPAALPPPPAVPSGMAPASASASVNVPPPPKPRPSSLNRPVMAGGRPSVSSSRGSTGGARPPSQPPSGELPLPAPPLPAGLGMEDKARWIDLAAAYDNMDARNHFELLGVTEAASEREIQTAFFGLVKRFHPDRLPPALAPLNRCAQLLFERLSEANETLSNAELRAAYVKNVHDGGGTRAAERMMRDVIESALEHQKAEVLMKRREYPQALQMIRSAITRNPSESDYYAMQGWLLHLMNPGENAPFDEILKSFDRAIKEHPKNERANYYKGVVLKRLGRDDEAYKYFRVAVEVNPRNVDAAREVRLASMRKHTKSAPPQQGGLLSKFFRGPGKEKG